VKSRLKKKKRYIEVEGGLCGKRKWTSISRERVMRDKYEHSTSHACMKISS
jgi:hypothetical protein